MSITKDFEKRPKETALFAGHGEWFATEDVLRLLAHTRALEAMLKKHEWCENDTNWRHCDECGTSETSGHKPDCQLAKLIEGVE